MIENKSAKATRERDGWRKSSYSNSSSGACVEVNHRIDTIFVRDSKDRRPDQPIIDVSSEAWGSFIGAVGRLSQ